MLEQSSVFSGRSSIHISNSAPSLSIVSDAAWGSLPLTVQHLYNLWYAILFYWSPSACHLNPCPWKERFLLEVANVLSM